MPGYGTRHVRQDTSRGLMIWRVGGSTGMDMVTTGVTGTTLLDWSLFQVYITVMSIILL